MLIKEQKRVMLGGTIHFRYLERSADFEDQMPRRKKSESLRHDIAPGKYRNILQHVNFLNRAFNGINGINWTGYHSESCIVPLYTGPYNKTSIKYQTRFLQS